MTYKDQCSECTGSCQTEEALTTDEMYDSFGEPLEGVSLTLGHYDGETFVAA